MSETTFKKVYDSAKYIIDKNNPNSKISKLSIAEGAVINDVIGKDTNQKVKSIKVTFDGISVSENSVKQTYVEFIRKICAKEESYSKLKTKGWIFSESDYNSAKDDYAEIKKQEAYIYTNCNVDLLIVKIIKAVIDIEKENSLENSVLNIEFTDDTGSAPSASQGQSNIDNSVTKNNISAVNKIYYGIPGCGKSYKIQAMLDYEEGFQEDANLLGITKPVDSANIFRTTFYLDYTNSDFVGQLMPKTDEMGNVKYKPVFGPFTKALKRANETGDMVFLVIEEINRGNAAAIFGDIFQLLDRYREDKGVHKKGESMYPITNDFIEEYLNMPTGQVIIPSNMSILATMNTSDQNVFPLDTAFKRRWDRERVVPDWKNPNIKNLVDLYVPGTSKKWSEFAQAVNDELSKESKDGMVLEDKQLGPFYVGKDILCAQADQDDTDRIHGFVNNVVDYLYNDVTKFDHSILFETFNGYDELYDSVFDAKQGKLCVARGALYGLKFLQMKSLNAGTVDSNAEANTEESDDADNG